MNGALARLAPLGPAREQFPREHHVVDPALSRPPGVVADFGNGRPRVVTMTTAPKCSTIRADSARALLNYT